MEPVLQIKGVSISFTQYSGGLQQAELPVIRDLSLTVRLGQVVAVVGASGSGKSLLAHGILGLLPYNSRMEGEILYEGAPLTASRAAKLRGKEIALVPQGVTYLDPGSSQMGKKESMEDTAKVLGRFFDGIEYRGYDQAVVECLAKHSGVPVYNGLTDVDHPTQIIADMMTME